MRTFVSLLVLAALLAPASVVPAAASGGFGVTPVQLDFTDPPLLRGAVVEGTLRLQNRDSTPTRVTVTPEGSLAGWVSLDSPAEFTIEPGATRTLGVRLAVPESAPNGDHSGFLRLRARGGSEPSGSGATTQVELLPAIRARITGDQVVAFALEHVELDDPAVDTPLLFKADLINKGNVRETPKLDVVVRARDGTELIRETLAGRAIEPGTTQTIEVATSRGLPRGPYTAVVSIPASMGGGEPIRIDFESRPGGSTARPAGAPTGEVAQTQLPTAPKPGKVATFSAEFHNSGDVDVKGARLTVEIYRGPERIAVVLSDTFAVAAGETVNLEAFWTPTVPGDYTARSYVAFDGTRTTVEQGEVAVQGAPARAANGAAAEGPSSLLAIAGVAVGVLALAAIVGFVLLARRRRKEE